MTRESTFKRTARSLAHVPTVSSVETKELGSQENEDITDVKSENTAAGKSMNPAITFSWLFEVRCSQQGGMSRLHNLSI